MIEQIQSYLDALKLRKTKEIIAQELKAAQDKKSSYSAFLLNLLRAEHEDKLARRVESRIKQSGLTELWTLETYPFHIQQCISKKQHYEFAELDFITRAENIVWIGATGVGKTGLASAILLKALYSGKSGKRVKAQDLFDDLGNSQFDRSTQALIKRLSLLDVLLIDELGYVNPRPDQVNSFFRLIDSRSNKKATLFTSNIGYQDWPKFLGNSALTPALLNRLTRNCHTIIFNKGVNLCTPKYKLPGSK